MYNGVKAMIAAEKALGGGPAAAPAGGASGEPVECGPHLKSPSQLTGPPKWPAGTKSLVSKYVTPDLFNKHKGTKDKAGVPFE